MAHAFSLSDGTTTVALNNLTTTMVTKYPIQSPAPALFAPNQASGDQGLTAFEWSNTTESLTILILGANIAAVQTTVRSIQTLLETGRRRQNTGGGPRLFLIVTLDGEGSTWRSEILAGRLLFTDAGDQLQRLKVEAVLSITRRAFFEANTETAISMTSAATGTPAATVTLTNNNSANYFDILAAQVTGSLPAPLKLKLLNADGAGRNWREVFITNTVFANSTGSNLYLLGSASTISGAAITLTAGVEMAAWRWTLSDALLTQLAGQQFRILAAFPPSNLQDVYLRPVVEVFDGIAYPMYRGGRAFLTAEGLIDLGSVPLPPGGYDVANTSMAFAIYAYSALGGSMTIDFVQLTPAGSGLFRKMRLPGFVTVNGEGWVDDGPEGTAYYITAAAKHQSVVRAEGSPVMVWPGRDQRMRVLFRESDFRNTRIMTAAASYRARRVDL